MILFFFPAIIPMSQLIVFGRLSEKNFLVLKLFCEVYVYFFMFCDGLINALKETEKLREEMDCILVQVSWNSLCKSPGKRSKTATKALKLSRNFLGQSC